MILNPSLPAKNDKFAKIQFIAKSSYKAKNVQKNAQIATNYTFLKRPSK